MCLENSFSHIIPSMFHASRKRDIRTSPFWSYKDLNFEKLQGCPNFSIFLIFQMKYFSWFEKFRKYSWLILAHFLVNFKENWSWKLLRIQFSSKIGSNSNFPIFRKKSKISNCHKNWLVIGMNEAEIFRKCLSHW